MALSLDEFKQLRSQGVPFDQIQRIDKIDTIRQDPSMQGGANAPALVKARQDVSKTGSPLEFAKQHPFLAGFQGVPELLTGVKAGDFCKK